MITINFNKIKSKQVVVELTFQTNYYGLDGDEHTELMKLYRKLSNRNESLNVNVPNDRNKIADIFNQHFIFGGPRISVSYPDYTLPESFLTAYNNKYDKYILFTKTRPFHIKLDKYLKYYEGIKRYLENDYIRITDVS